MKRTIFILLSLVVLCGAWGQEAKQDDSFYRIWMAADDVQKAVICRFFVYGFVYGAEGVKILDGDDSPWAYMLTKIQDVAGSKEWIESVVPAVNLFYSRPSNRYKSIGDAIWEYTSTFLEKAQT